MKTVEDARAEIQENLAQIVGATAPPGENPEDPEHGDPPGEEEKPKEGGGGQEGSEPQDPTPAAASPDTPGEPATQDPEKPSAPDKPADDDPERYVKLEKSYGELRTLWNRTENQNKALQEQIELLAAAGNPANFAPMPPAQGPPPQGVAPAEQPAAEPLEAVRRKMAEEYDEGYVDQHSELIGAIVREELEKVRGAYDPVISKLTNSVEWQEEDRRNDAAKQWFGNLRAAVPNFEQIAESDSFTVWVDQHPFRDMFRALLWPEPGQPGATWEEAAKIFNDYKAESGQSQPPPEPAPNGNQSSLPENDAAAARAAAAAESNQGTVPLTSPPAIPGQAPTMMRSEFLREFNEVKNDPAKVRELRGRMETSMAAGQFYDDMTGPRPTSY